VVEELKRGGVPSRALANITEIGGFVLTSVLTRPLFPVLSCEFTYENRRGQRLNYGRGRGLGRGRCVGVDLGDDVAVGIGLGVPPQCPT